MQDNVTQAENTDREIWREREGDYYADSIHVTQQGSIGINCGGHVIQMPVRDWHRLASTTAQTEAVQKLVDALEQGNSVYQVSLADQARMRREASEQREAFERIATYSVGGHESYAEAFDHLRELARQALAAHRESQP